MKPWPIVEKFLEGLPAGSVGLDIGCGNGKYMPVNPNIFILASDRYVTYMDRKKNYMMCNFSG